MTISEDKIAQVRDRADIVAIVGKRVQLKKAGRTYVGLCPFHNERSPSFNVIPDRGFYHCFGCQASGDVFKFIMQTEHSPFPVVVRDLAREVGVDIPMVEEAPAEKRAREQREFLYRVNDFVNEYFVHQLWSSRDAAHARAYVEKRQLTKETALTFAIGYAPRRAEELVRYLEHKNVPVETAVELGVLGRREDKSLYLRFFDRVMFPIHDERDRIAGFGGRVLDADAKAAKYLNSPESPIFKKSRLLYGYSKAKNAIARKNGSWLCEGYLDVIALHQAGCDQAVAPLGTAVTEDHLPLLKRVSTRVRTVFDGDGAGLRATRKSAELLLSHGFSVYVVALPDGDDPDTYVLREGGTAMQSLADAAPPAVQFFIDRVASTMEASVEGRVSAASDVAPLIAKVTSQLERDLYVTEASKRLGIDADSLRKFFSTKVLNGPPAVGPRNDKPLGAVTPPRPQSRPQGGSGSGWDALLRDGPPPDENIPRGTPPEAEERPAPQPVDVVEWNAIRRLLSYRATWEALPKAMEYVTHPGLKAIIAICIENPDNCDYDTLSQLLDQRSELVSNLAQTLADDRSPALQEGERERMMEDVLSKLEHYFKRRALPQTAVTPEDEIELMRQRAALAREQKLKKRR